jgi:hypothetical protein
MVEKSGRKKYKTERNGRSSWECLLFHNHILFGSCIIHILNTGVLKFKRKFWRQKVNFVFKPICLQKKMRFISSKFCGWISEGIITCDNTKGNGKARPQNRLRRPKETSPLEGVALSKPRLGRFSTVKHPVPTCIIREARLVPGRVRKISPPPGFDPRTVQPVTSRYTFSAIPACENIWNIMFSTVLMLWNTSFI